MEQQRSVSESGEERVVVPAMPESPAPSGVSLSPGVVSNRRKKLIIGGGAVLLLSTLAVGVFFLLKQKNGSEHTPDSVNQDRYEGEVSFEIKGKRFTLPKTVNGSLTADETTLQQGLKEEECVKAGVIMKHLVGRPSQKLEGSAEKQLCSAEVFALEYKSESSSGTAAVDQREKNFILKLGAFLLTGESELFRNAVYDVGAARELAGQYIFQYESRYYWFTEIAGQDAMVMVESRFGSDAEVDVQFAVLRAVQEIFPSKPVAANSEIKPIEPDRALDEAGLMPKSIGAYSRANPSVKQDCGDEACMELSQAQYRSSTIIVVDIVDVKSIEPGAKKQLDDAYVETTMDGLLARGNSFHWRNTESRHIHVSYLPMSEYEKEKGIRGESAPTQSDRVWPALTADHEVVQFFLKKYPSMENRNALFEKLFPKSIGTYTLSDKGKRIVRSCPPQSAGYREYAEYCGTYLVGIYVEKPGADFGIQVYIGKLFHGSVDALRMSLNGKTMRYFPDDARFARDVWAGAWFFPSSQPDVDQISVQAVELDPQTGLKSDATMLRKENPVFRYFIERYPPQDNLMPGR
jgi:hypothetical protein